MITRTISTYKIVTVNGIETINEKSAIINANEEDLKKCKLPLMKVDDFIDIKFHGDSFEIVFKKMFPE